MSTVRQQPATPACSQAASGQSGPAVFFDSRRFPSVPRSSGRWEGTDVEQVLQELAALTRRLA